MDLRRFSRSRFRAAAVVLFGSLAAVVGSAVGWAVEPAPSGKKLDFNREVKPILAANCFSCHGPDDKHREGGLRLDQRAAALKPADGGAPAIVPAKPDESELL
ncbi:MAG: c-type cytochrome domain-containing protein [Planctomycetia bacterium]